MQGHDLVLLLLLGIGKKELHIVAGGGLLNGKRIAFVPEAFRTDLGKTQNDLVPQGRFTAPVSCVPEDEKKSQGKNSMRGSRIMIVFFMIF